MTGLSLDEYQARAKETAVYPGEDKIPGIGVIYCVLGLNGEAGEIAEHVKKILRDDSGLFTTTRTEAMRKEVGDCLWYIAMLADELGFNLSTVAEENLEKLASRQERGVLSGSGDER